MLTAFALSDAASSAGNLIGPLLFQSSDAPTYHPGLRAVLGIFVALAACTIIQAANLMFLNRLQERKRVKNGKPQKLKDMSMYDHFEEDEEEQPVHREGEAPPPYTRIGDQALLDLTDRKNDEFIYIY